MIVFLDNIRSAHNVGTIFRTADALGVSKLYLGGITAGPVDKYGLENRKLSKVALGAEKSVASEKVQDLGLVLEKYADYTILSLEINQESEDLYQYLKSEKLDLQKIVLIVGNEVEGVSKSLLAKSHRVVHLPMNGVKESLNVAVAFAVAAYALIYFKT